MEIVVWFSNGAASAIAWQETLRQYPHANVTAVNHPIAEEDEDNTRFARDVAQWLGQELVFATNPKYNSSAEEVWRKRKAMAFPHGAPCTQELKKEARYLYEKNHHIDYHVLGFTVEEKERFKRFTLTERDNVLPVLIDAGLTKQDCYDRLLAAGIEPPRVYKLGMPNANCFSGETKFITREGLVCFKHKVGQTVEVKTAGAGAPWREARVESFGKQSIVELTLKRGKKEKTIRTTDNHRWFVGTTKHNKEVITKNLCKGDRLVSRHTNIHSRVKPSVWGIARGIVFGDGSMQGGTRGASARLMLCGEKSADLSKYFPLSPQKETAVGTEICGLPRDWKTLPCIEMDDSFLLGWLSGYFATDGCASASGDYLISSSKIEHLEAARDIAIRLGISVGSIRSIEREGFGKMSVLYSLPLVGHTLNESFFLRNMHKERFLSKPTREPHPWFVERIRYTGESEEVYCVVEPVSKTFVLEDNILTGNCLGCVKASSATYWNLTREKFPEVFEARSKLSRELGVKLAYHKGKRIFLDELPADAKGYKLKKMEHIECGIFCEEKGPE